MLAEEIHVWSASLTPPDKVLAEYRNLLSPTEQARAARFRFDVHRSRYIAEHAILRLLLAKYLPLPPREFTFTIGAHGKPGLPEDPLYFNMSGSEDWALFAFTQMGPIGVDIERVRPLDDMDQVAARMFSQLEAASLAALPLPERVPAFFRCWTRKEAFIKAIGKGLSFPLDRFTVSIDEGSAALLELDPIFGEARDWALHHVASQAGFVGAAAIRGQECPIRQFSFS